MPLEGLAGQQTEFNIKMAEAMLGVMRQESIMRQARLDQMTQYLQQLELKKHEEALAKRKRNQALGLQLGAIGTTTGLGALFPPTAAASSSGGTGIWGVGTGTMNEYGGFGNISPSLRGV